MFSASYWVIAENIKSKIYKQEMRDTVDYQTLIMANFMAGSIAGAISGIITLPLDVVKTRKQLQTQKFNKQSLIQTFKEIHHKEGLDGLFLGIRPRMAKTVIHCSLVLTIYELTLKSLSQIPHL